MSFLNGPDARTLGLVAGALAVDEAFVEKDWYIVQAISTLVACGTADITPIFSGGTALLKGHGLIRRFSEDIDFKLALSAEFEAMSPGQRRTVLSDLKKGLADAWSKAGFVITGTKAGSGNGFIQIDMDYPTVLDGHDALRPHIQAELSAKPPRLPTVNRPLTSFVRQYRVAEPEIASVPCIDPVETAADKLSAFCWRMLTRDRTEADDDGTIVRHLHDLAAIESVAAASDVFPELVKDTLIADSGRGGGVLADIAPAERLVAMLARLTEDVLYPDEYARFVGGMAFAGEAEIPSFDAAVLALRRLSALLPPS